MGRIAEMKTEDMRKIIDSFIDSKNNKAENFIKEHEPQRIDTADDLKMCLGFAYVLYKRCYEKNIFDMRNTAAKIRLLTLYKIMSKAKKQSFTKMMNWFRPLYILWNLCLKRSIIIRIWCRR